VSDGEEARETSTDRESEETRDGVPRDAPEAESEAPQPPQSRRTSTRTSGRRVTPSFAEYAAFVFLALVASDLSWLISAWAWGTEYIAMPFTTQVCLSVVATVVFRLEYMTRVA
jgi:hypothetical protein